MKPADKTPDQKIPARRKPYSAPRLLLYGHVKDIVQGNSGGRSDAASTRNFCWIAEAIYGGDDPRTLTLRWWVTGIYEQRQQGWMFAALYRKLGRQVAAAIRHGWIPRPLLTPLFDALAEKAFDESVRTISHARPRRAV